MAGKSKILEVIGGGKEDLLLMDKVKRALQANERVKYLLTLLQLAQAQAEQPDPEPDDLSIERRRAGIEDSEFDQVIPNASMTRGNRLEIPIADRILSMALEETDRMCDPLVTARRPEGPTLKRRLDDVGTNCRPYVESGAEAGADVDEAATAEKPPGKVQLKKRLPVEFIGRLTSAERGGQDSLHLVVMDAHKAINSLISELSGHRETVGGADALGLTEEDRRLVEAFTEGVNSTRSLKGSHPGLATTAVRVGAKLLLQNDVGETDAHVVVLEVEGNRLDITYTDVHDKRTDFFSRLLGDLPIQWRKAESRYSKKLTESAFTLSRGTLETVDRVEMGKALRVIGSSLVFLIDWNKARKRLRNFVRGQDGIDILLWAARERVGHMSFLSYGDVELIYEALEALPRGTIRRGEPLSAILGRKGAFEFLKETLRLAWESYERKEPRALLLDRLRCLLLGRVQRRGMGSDEMLLELSVLGVETAITFRDSLRCVTRPVEGLIARNFDRISRWEQRADERLNRIRKIHLKEPQSLLPVGMLVDDALDALEDAADIALALEAKFDARALPRNLIAMLERGAELTVRAAQLFHRVVHRYRELVRGGIGEALFDLINDLKQAEVEGDKLKRDFHWTFLSAEGDLKILLTLRELLAKQETALNAFGRAAFLIHDLAYAAMEQIHG